MYIEKKLNLGTKHKLNSQLEAKPDLTVGFGSGFRVYYRGLNSYLYYFGVGFRSSSPEVLHPQAQGLRAVLQL